MPSTRTTAAEMRELRQEPHCCSTGNAKVLMLHLLHPISVVAVHHKDEAVCIMVVVAPQWANLVLNTENTYCQSVPNTPYSEQCLQLVTVHLNVSQHRSHRKMHPATPQTGRHTDTQHTDRQTNPLFLHIRF